MSDAETFHNDLIVALGGKAKLAKALCLEPVAVTKWHERGIPARYWHKVIGLAASLDPPVVVTADELDQRKPIAAKAAA